MRCYCECRSCQPSFLPSLLMLLLRYDDCELERVAVLQKMNLGLKVERLLQFENKLVGSVFFPSATVIHSDKCMHTFESTLRALESILTNRIAF